MPSPGYLPDPGIELGSPELQVDSLPGELPGKPVLGTAPSKIHCLHASTPGIVTMFGASLTCLPYSSLSSPRKSRSLVINRK